MRQRKYFSRYSQRGHKAEDPPKDPFSGFERPGGVFVKPPPLCLPQPAYLFITYSSEQLLSNMMNNKRITKAVAILLGTAAIVKIAYYEAEMVSVVHLCLLILRWFTGPRSHRILSCYLYDLHQIASLVSLPPWQQHPRRKTSTIHPSIHVITARLLITASSQY